MGKMDFKTKESLIASLAEEFGTAKPGDIQINPSSYIENTGTLDCSVYALDVDTLKKTKAVIEQFEEKYINVQNTEAAQYLHHLRIAKKCVDEIIHLKIKEG